MQEHFENNDELEIDLLELCRVLWEKIGILILCFVIGAVAAGTFTKFLITPKYSATSSIYILGASTDLSSLNLSLSSQLTSDFMILAKSRPVLEKVIEDQNLDMTYEELSEIVSVQNPAETTILQITVINESPTVARDIANSMSEVTADRVAEVMDMDRPNIVESAVAPEDPSSPSLIKNTAIGALLGLFLAIAVITVGFILDDTIKDEEDVRKYLGVNTLAAFPKDGAVKTSKKKKARA